MQGEGREGMYQEYQEAEHGGQDHGVLELNNIDNVSCSCLCYVVSN